MYEHLDQRNNCKQVFVFSARCRHLLDGAFLVDTTCGAYTCVHIRISVHVDCMTGVIRFVEEIRSKKKKKKKKGEAAAEF